MTKWNLWLSSFQSSHILEYFTFIKGKKTKKKILTYGCCLTKKHIYNRKIFFKSIVSIRSFLQFPIYFIICSSMTQLTSTLAESSSLSALSLLSNVIFSYWPQNVVCIVWSVGGVVWCLSSCPPQSCLNNYYYFDGSKIRGHQFRNLWINVLI